jgi:hypothetical protein
MPDCMIYTAFVFTHIKAIVLRLVRNALILQSARQKLQNVFRKHGKEIVDGCNAILYDLV